ncbi:unnamed protein product [Coregonus sp. 'balchen']|nr:unnamed protein product [Coregonus sp. 'balchen']
MDCNLGTVENSAARLVPGGVPQYVLRWYHTGWSSVEYGSGFSSPKFPSNHQSKSDYRLIINTVEETDSAVYYCQTYDSSVKEHVSHGELKSSKVILVCLASQMAMGYADVSWTAGGNPVTSGIATSGPVPQADKTFRLSSCLTVDTSEWNQVKVFSCISGVTVVTQKPPVVTWGLLIIETATMDCNLGTVDNRDGQYGLRPLWTVTWGQLIIETATMDCNLGTVENSAARLVPGGVPQYVLRWYHTGWSSVEYGSGFSSPKFPSNHQSKSDYRLIINTVEETDSAVYYYGDLSTPAVTLFPPSTEDLKSSRATLRSKGFADVSWMSNGESVTEYVFTSPAEQQPDKTFKISSYLIIQTAEWDKDVVFTCKVSLGSTFSEKEIRKTGCSL